MLSWLYEMFMSFVTFILSLLGLSSDKKTVTFAEDTKDGETPLTQDTSPTSEQESA
jgi:hypothetical protein